LDKKLFALENEENGRISMTEDMARHKSPARQGPSSKKDNRESIRDIVTELTKTSREQKKTRSYSLRNETGESPLA